MACKACTERGKPWTGGDPKCAFEDDGFSKDNWMCASMSKLRFIAMSGVAGTWHYRDDMCSASIGVVWIHEDASDEASGYITMTWYKQRGRVGRAFIVCDDTDPVLLTKSVAESVIEYYENKYAKEMFS